MKVVIDEDGFTLAVAEDLLWHAEAADLPKMREHLLQAAFYYMTFDQVAQYLGSTEEAEEYFR